ncbi:MAG: hypothetical protein O3C25_03075 [Chloroflexi bacterium]|nr:hypothetical protein [Chloroflexota bacterium]
MLFEQVDELKEGWDRLLDLAEGYRAGLDELREEERARPEPAARRLRTLDVAIREADDLVAAIDDTVGDRLLRVQDRQVILQKIPFAEAPVADAAAPEARRPAG